MIYMLKIFVLRFYLLTLRTTKMNSIVKVEILLIYVQGTVNFMKIIHNIVTYEIFPIEGSLL